MSSVSPSSSIHCFVSIKIVLSDQIQDKREGGGGSGDWSELIRLWIGLL